MVSLRYGGRRGRIQKLKESGNLIVLRTRSRGALWGTTLTKKGRRLLDGFEPVLAFPSAGVEVFRLRSPSRSVAPRDMARRTLRREESLEFAGRCLVDPASGAPVVYTENLFVKFRPDAKGVSSRRKLGELGLRIRREVDYAVNAYFVSAPPGTGLRVFEIAERLLEDPAVELCHPELVREVRRRVAFPAQWHLKATVVGGVPVDAHAKVEAAWEIAEGKGVTVAIIDDGIDIDHPEFKEEGKVVAPRDVTLDGDDPRPGAGDLHGTACAGVACAAGVHGASGVAPKARLLPVRLASGLGSQDEADAFFWAARNGADVISCSWGPVDGDWWNASDPLHRQKVLLPDSTRLAIDWAVEQGRSSKGCIVVFAAGNGNESVDRDGYASYEKVMAVAAVNDRGVRSAYSDHGSAVWCAFPSSGGVPTLTKGIWTTDRRGRAGYNPGRESLGDVAGNYTNAFGGTSSAAPGAAGVAALVLSVNPHLGWMAVRDILKRSAERVDPKGGRYDREGRSPYYGWGRLDARKAVELARAVG